MPANPSVCPANKIKTLLYNTILCKDFGFLKSGFESSKSEKHLSSSQTIWLNNLVNRENGSQMSVWNSHRWCSMNDESGADNRLSEGQDSLTPDS